MAQGAVRRGQDWDVQGHDQGVHLLRAIFTGSGGVRDEALSSSTRDRYKSGLRIRSSDYLIAERTIIRWHGALTIATIGT